MENQKRSKEKFNVKCEYCGKDLTIRPYELQYEKHFCNTKCYHLYISQEAKNKEIKTKCAYCGKDIIKKIINKIPKNYFCSCECNNKYQKEQSQKSFIEVKCSNCGKIFKKRKINISKKQNLFFCSRECNFEYKKIVNKYIINENNKIAKIIIPCKNKNYEVLIDTEDVEKCKKYFWQVRNLNYVRSKEIGLLHRYIMNCPDDMVIDHINHNPLDNRKCNLRVVNTFLNAQNKLLAKNNTSGYKYICFYKKTQKYRVGLRRFNKYIFIGNFNTLEEAVKARDEYIASLNDDIESMMIKGN